MNTGESICRPQVVVVGGFLGAGKTSLILAATDTLSKRGIRSAVILNDQSQQLVDTRNASERGIISGEVTGGCFCCRFSELIAAMDSVRAHAPNVIFAEPVGSCTDISATVLGPLSEEFGLYRVAPFTVLVDPARAEALQSAGADPHLAFLFEKQLEEADLVCLTKADLYTNARIPGISARYLSAKTGQGVREWLDDLVRGR